MLNRRDFIGQFAAGFGALTFPSLVARAEEKEQEKPFDANAFIEAFPEKGIPGIGLVKKYPLVIPPEQDIAKVRQKALFFFGQGHPLYDGEHVRVDLMSEGQITETEQCQLNMYHAIQYLRSQKEYELRSLLLEGVIHGQEKKTMDGNRTLFREEIRNMLYSSVPYAFFNPSESLINDAQRDEKMITARRKAISLLGLHGAGPVLHYNSGLPIVGAENVVLKHRVDYELRRATKLGDEVNYGTWSGMAYDAREDYLLEYAKQQDGNVSYTIFGKNHSFVRNIEVWNNDKNEPVKFAHIVLTPKVFITEESQSSAPAQNPSPSARPASECSDSR